MLFFLITVCILVIALLLIINLFRNKSRSRYDSRGFDSNRIHKNGTKYDDSGYDFYGYNADGFNRKGYNKSGKNLKGQYNRLYDAYSCKEEGFKNPVLHPVVLSNHARDRMRERLGIVDTHKMNELTLKAYCYGKSKRQIMKTSAFHVEEIEQKYDNSNVLIYQNVIYIFSDDNVLKTVYRNDRVPL